MLRCRFLRSREDDLFQVSSCDGMRGYEREEETSEDGDDDDGDIVDASSNLIAFPTTMNAYGSSTNYERSRSFLSGTNK